MPQPPTVRRSALALFVVLCSFVLFASPVCAQAGDDDPEVTAQAKEHYKAGLAAYQAGKYDVAIRELKKAYSAKRLPPLLLNIGATYRKIGDLDLSLHFYQKYLDEAPSDAHDRTDVEKIIAELKVQKSTQATEDVGGEAPAPRETSSRRGEWKHNVIDAAPPETPIDVRVSTPPMKGVKVFVFFRVSGQADYSSILMKRRGNEKVGRIPAEAVTGHSLQYYIEAKDASGTVVKSAGDSGNPNIIMIEEGVKPVMIASGNHGDDNAEEQEEDTKSKKRRSNSELDEESAPTGANLDSARTPYSRNKKKSSGSSGLAIAGYSLLGVGAGVAIIGGVLMGISHHEGVVLSNDSKSSTSASGSNAIYWNNDPKYSGTQEKALASRAHGENIGGAVLIGIGAGTAVAAIGCLIADAVSHSNGDHPKKKSKTKRHAVEEEEETTNWHVAPILGPSVAGISGGFSF